MILTDGEILARMQMVGHPQQIVIDPFVGYLDKVPRGAIGYGMTSCGYDLRVGHRFLVLANSSGCRVDPKDFRMSRFQEVRVGPSDAVTIPPNGFALAESVERFRVPRDCCVHILCKSTYARCGICLNMTPLEPEWDGVVTIEIANMTPLPAVVYAGEGIGQAQFHRIDASMLQRSYQEKPRRLYQGQTGLTGPRVWKE